MERFNIKRFGNVLKWDFMNNWKYTLWLFLVMIVVFTCMLGLVYFNASSEYSIEVTQTVINEQAGVCSVILSFIVLAGASRMFLPLKDKQSATALLALPASSLEKFLARIVNIIFLWTALGIIAFLCADALQMVLAKLLGAKNVVSGTAAFFDVSKHLRLDFNYWAEGTQMHINLFLIPLLILTTYMLGSILFRRRQFWVTTVIIFAINVIAVIAIANIGTAIEPWLEEHHEQIMDFMLRHFDDPLGLLRFAIHTAEVIAGITAVVFTWLTYRLFKRAQVINNKFLNV